ncbi:MAG: LTA synthase family protein, partial [Saprospiraceae bacterium]|nr:LTA synthase family protein [Saprospiraceae bacterium]
LNSVSRILTREGDYSTLFCYGGELTFANIGSWLRGQRFEKIISESDFSRSEKTQRWGVDDERLLHHFLLNINEMKQPFLATALTLSLHPPYDVPFSSQWNGNNDREKFLNSAAFADKAIGAFFEEARRQPWYDRTVFVLVADHGASLPGGMGLDHPRSRQVPLLMIGKPLKSDLPGHRVKAVCGHHDIPATVLGGLMGYPASRLKEHFPWSRDLTQWSDNSGFGYYTNENGLGWVTNDGEAFLPFSTREWHVWSGNSSLMAQQNAQAYLQMLYTDFLSR